MTVDAGLLDTSVIVALELGQSVDRTLVPTNFQISVITIAELQAGIHAASDTEERAARMATLGAISSLEPLQVDPAAAHEWARMRHRLSLAGRRINVNDLWIAAIAVANRLPVVTRDRDFDVLEDLGGPVVIRV